MIQWQVWLNMPIVKARDAAGGLRWVTGGRGWYWCWWERRLICRPVEP